MPLASPRAETEPPAPGSAPARRAAIRFESVGKTYPARRGQGPVAALRDVTLDVPEGAIVGVIGRSGAGKSTLIRLVNGLETVDAGRLIVGDVNVTGFDETRWRAERRSIGRKGRNPRSARRSRRCAVSASTWRRSAMFPNLTPPVIDLIVKATLDTLIMVAVAGGVGVLVGLPLGVFLAASRKGELFAAPALNATLGALVNVTRSTPFIILMVAIIPLTRAIVGASIGAAAAIVPLSVAAAPFSARIVEGAIREVDHGLVEAARAMGATPLQTVRTVLIPEEPYLDNQTRDRGYRIEAVAQTVNFPMGVYSRKLKTAAEIKDGAVVAIPNDPTNGGRALLLLQDKGLVKLRPDAGLKATIADIAENSRKLKIVEVDAAQTVRSLDDVDLAAINTNYAIEAKLDPTAALLREEPKGPYVNLIVVRTADKDKAWVKTLVEAYQSAPVKAFVQERFKGAVLTAW